VLEVRRSILLDPNEGVCGYAWAMRRETLQKMRFFSHCVYGDGDAFHLFAWRGALPPHVRTSVAYYLHAQSSIRAQAERYFKRVRMHFGGRAPTCRTMPPAGDGGSIALRHLYHGDRAPRQLQACFESRRFQILQHMRASASGLPTWTDTFRAAGVNASVRSALERSVSRRRQARTQLRKNLALLQRIHLALQEVNRMQKVEDDSIRSDIRALTKSIRACGA